MTHGELHEGYPITDTISTILQDPSVLLESAVIVATLFVVFEAYRRWADAEW
jgi:hypothetical protein